MSKKKEQKQNESIGLDAQLTKSEAFIERNLKTILIVLGVICAAVIGYFIWKNHKAKVQAEAVEAVYSSQNYFARGEYEKALKGDNTPACKGFLKVMDEYSGSKTANVSKLYAGICYANLDDYDNAIKMLESYDEEDDVMISSAALGTLGNCYIHKGQEEKGAETLVKAAKQADNFSTSPVFLLQAGLVYEKLGKADKALELYQQIKKDYPQSPLSNEIDKYIERATK